MTSPQHVEHDGVISFTEGSVVLHKLLYAFGDSPLSKVRDYTACPHDGGVHRLTVNDTREKCIIFIDELIEIYGECKWLEWWRTSVALASENTTIEPPRNIKSLPCL